MKTVIALGVIALSLIFSGIHMTQVDAKFSQTKQYCTDISFNSPTEIVCFESKGQCNQATIEGRECFDQSTPRENIAKTGPNHVYCGVTDSRECWDKSKECEEFADNCHRVDNNAFDQNGIACPHIRHSEKGEKFAEKNDRKEAKQNDEAVEELAVEDDNDSVDEQDTDDGIVPPEVEELAVEEETTEEEPIEEVEKEIEDESENDEESSEANNGD